MAEKTYQSSIFTSFSSQWIENKSKRLFDIVVSAVMLILLAPFFGLIALAIRRDSPGPVFYRGRRIGRGGKIFHILKFRTMYDDPQSFNGPKVTAHDDTRITPLGHWMRNTKLNELPQFWNVLKGDMSMVGPRPEDPDIASDWPKDVRDEVLSVRPGITSPASVQYHNEESMLSMGNVLQKYIQEVGPDKMRLDQLYVRYRSFWLDLDTILWTALIILPKLGIDTVPESMLFVGPVTRLMRRYLNWFTIDTIITFCAIAFTGVVWRMYRPLNVGLAIDITMTLIFSLLFSIIGGFFGVNRISWLKATFTDVYDLFPSWALATLITVTINRAFKIFPTTMVLTASLLALAGYIFTRYRSRLITGFLSRVLTRQGQEGIVRERALIIGAGPAAQHMAWLLYHPTNADKYQIVGFVDNNLMHQGMRIYGAKVLGTCKDIPHLVEKHRVGRVFLADQNIFLKEYQAIARMCSLTSAKLLVVPDILSNLSKLVETSPISQRPLEIPATGGAPKSRVPADTNAPTVPVKYDPCMHCFFHHVGEDSACPNEQQEKVV